MLPRAGAAGIQERIRALCAPPLEITLPVVALTEPLPSQLPIGFLPIHPSLLRLLACCMPSSFFPGFLAGEFCRSFFPFPRGFALANKGGPEESVVPGKCTRLQRSRRRRPELHSSPHVWRALAFPRSFHFFPVSPCFLAMSQAQCPSAELVRQRGTGGRLLLRLPCLRERHLGTRGFLCRGKNGGFRSPAKPAHRRGFRSNPCK